MRLKVIGKNLCNLTEQNMCHSGLSHPYITPTAASNVAANTTVKDILPSPIPISFSYQRLTYLMDGLKG
jgi:hypothetical protein